jgi:hypothetical protein
METLKSATLAGFGTHTIATGINTVLNRKKKVVQQHVNRISALDDPCLRKLYYMRAAWDKAVKTKDDLQGIFETGNILEPVIERIVSEVGQSSSPLWRIVGSQTSTNDNLLKEYQISGTIDGFLQVYNEQGVWETLGVIDIKTMSPNIFSRVNDYNSLGRYSWTRKYRGQLQLYALAHNLGTCFILLVNKSNLYDMKLIDFALDMAYCDSLLEKAKTINGAIKTNTVPTGINDPDMCPSCQFFSFCCPEYSTGGNLEVVDNAELESVLERMAELEPATKEYDELAATRDEMLIKGQDVACGRWLVTWKQIEKNFKAQPAKEASTRIEFRKSIVCR